MTLDHLIFLVRLLLSRDLTGSKEPFSSDGMTGAKGREKFSKAIG